jgi:hypothetical protein
VAQEQASFQLQESKQLERTEAPMAEEVKDNTRGSEQSKPRATQSNRGGRRTEKLNQKVELPQ